MTPPPVPETLKLNVPGVALAVVTVNVPVGVTGFGAIVQVDGLPVPQLRVTALLKPLIAVRVPLNTACPRTVVVCGVLLIARV